MPALPAVPNVLVVYTVFTVGSDTDIRTKWYFQYSGGHPSNADCSSLASAILALGVTNIVPCLPNPYLLTAVDVFDLNSASGGAGSASGTHNGTYGAATLSAQACLLVNATIARRYRGGKPRTYWPFGEPSDLSSPQTFNAAALTFYNSHLNSYRTGILALTASSTTVTEHVNVSYYEGFTVITSPTTGRARNVPKLRTGGPVVDQITGISANAKVGTQRRRVAA